MAFLEEHFEKLEIGDKVAMRAESAICYIGEHSKDGKKGYFGDCRLGPMDEFEEDFVKYLGALCRCINLQVYEVALDLHVCHENYVKLSIMD